MSNKLVSELQVIDNPIGGDLIIANHLGSTSTIPLSTIMNYIKDQIVNSTSYRTDIVNSLSSEYIKRPTTGLGVGKILAWDISTQTWVASAK